MMKQRIGMIAVLVSLVFVATTQAGIIPVFDYQFPASGSDLVTNTTVDDLSSADNNATADGFSGTGLSSMVPDVAPVGAMSLDCDGNARVLTNADSLLKSSDVANAGGYTFDVWFYLPSDSPSDVQKIIDYAGTESIGIEDHKLRIAVSDNVVSNDVSVELESWHHLVFQFDTLGNSAVADGANYKVDGEFSVWLDEIKVVDSLSVTKSGFGDSLNRGIGVGGHPLSSTTSERFDGLIFNPQVSLGVTAVPEPSVLACLVLGSLGLLFYRKRK